MDYHPKVKNGEIIMNTNFVKRAPITYDILP